MSWLGTVACTKMLQLRRAYPLCPGAPDRRRRRSTVCHRCELRGRVSRYPVCSCCGAQAVTSSCCPRLNVFGLVKYCSFASLSQTKLRGCALKCVATAWVSLAICFVVASNLGRFKCILSGGFDLPCVQSTDYMRASDRRSHYMLAACTMPAAWCVLDLHVAS